MHISYTIYGICGCKMGKPIEPPVFKKSYYYVIWDLKSAGTPAKFCLSIYFPF